MNQKIDITEKERLLKAARSFAKALMGTASHGWDHVERVIQNARAIGATEEGADPFVVEMAAILHDIGRKEQDAQKGKVCHAELGAAMATAWLKEQKVDQSLSEEIVHCILCHRFRGGNIPQTLEAKIIYDADKLDSTGAVGLGRSFLFAGEVGARLHNSHLDIERTEIGRAHV